MLMSLGGSPTLTDGSQLLMSLGDSPKKNRWSKPPTDSVLMNLVCSDSFPLLQLKDGSQLLMVCLPTLTGGLLTLTVC